jgi:hypothetical protein
LDNLATVDPSPLSDGLNGGLHALEGDTQAAKAALAQAAMGPVGDALRFMRGANRGLGFADDVAKNFGKHADEAADVAKKVDMPGTVMARVRALGKAGEDAVRGVHDIGAKSRIEVNGRYRVPDGLTRHALTEVKNVQSLSYTSQLRDYAQFARENGLVFRLFTRSDASLSARLVEEIQAGRIVHEIIPGT